MGSEMVKQETEIVRDEPRELTFTAEQSRMIRDTFANGASEAEFLPLMEVAKARKLNPLLRQIHFVKRWDSGKHREVWAVQVSIDGLRAIAERTGRYAGQDEPEFVEGPEGRPVSCKVRVYRKDWTRPAVGVAFWSEFVQTTRDKQTGKERPNAMWGRMPHLMLAKVAEALAIRKAFPEDTSGLYTGDEIPATETVAEEVRAEPQRQPEKPAPQLAAVSDDARSELPEALELFLSRVAEIDLPGEGVAGWMKHREALGALDAQHRERAWKALCAKVEEVGKMKNARVWLKKAIAEEDARRGNAPTPSDDPPPDGTTTPAKGRRSTTTAEGSAVTSSGAGGAPAASARGPVALPDWAFSRDTMRRHAAGDWKCIAHAENSVRLWAAFVPGLVEVASSWLQARGFDDASADGRASSWAKEGPRPRTVKVRRKAA